MNTPTEFLNGKQTSGERIRQILDASRTSEDPPGAERVKINITALPNGLNLPLPSPATAGSAGMDVYAAIEQPVFLNPGAIVLIPTGIAIEIPVGFECQVRSRSGLAAKNGVFALNAPGTIDSDYRGEIQVILANFSSAPYSIEPASRIAQLVVARYATVHWNPVSSLSSTERGEGGFGSTGGH
jgi:dUTP pyrophosphatase